MTKEQFRKAVKALQNISINFKIDYYFFSAKSFIRGIIINEPDDLSRVKSIIEPETMRNFKVKKSKAWYLGERKDVIYLQLRDELEMDISELEEMQVNNYA
ncbi:MAG: hypothetical protein N2510_03945 [Ignavibacteria bacterium]|nr:hypothetical protein [Ignavibacteria bacterium]